MAGNSKVLNAYENDVFLQIANVFKTPEIKKIILDYIINNTVYSLQLVLRFIRRNKGYRNLPYANKAFDWSFKSLEEFINDYQIIGDSLHSEAHDAIADNKLIEDIKSIENILMQLSKQCDPKSIYTYQINQLDQILEDLQEKYEDNKDKFYEMLCTKEDSPTANIITNMRRPKVSEDAKIAAFNDMIIERINYRTSLRLLSNNLKMTKTRLSLREKSLQQNIDDTEQSINTAMRVHNYKMDFNKREIEKCQREVERYTTEFELKVEEINNHINVTKFRLKEYRKLNQTLIYHIKSFDQAITQYKERESQIQASETDSESNENLETLSQLEETEETA